MSKKLHEILIGEGLGELKFGMSREQVKKLLGEADSVKDHTDEEFPELEWYYEEHEAHLVFDGKDNDSLRSISCSSEELLFKGEKIISMEELALLRYLQDSGIDDCQVENVNPLDDSTFSLFSENAGMNLWFEESLLIEVEWEQLESEPNYVLWKSEEEE